jgi:hypothetical protein
MKPVHRQTVENAPLANTQLEQKHQAVHPVKLENLPTPSVAKLGAINVPLENTRVK